MEEEILYTPKHPFSINTYKGFDYKDLTISVGAILIVNNITRHKELDGGFGVSMTICSESYKGYTFYIPFTVFNKCFIEIKNT